jgi:hypothetical protein
VELVAADALLRRAEQVSAWSHLFNGTWLLSNTVPTVTVNSFRQ